MIPAEAPRLAHETFRAIKPGLSAYADDPEKVQLLSLPDPHQADRFQTELNVAVGMLHPSDQSQSVSCPLCLLRSVQCTAGIQELLEVAQSSVPSSMWTLTPVVLKATAGLRLLPGEKAKHLLDQVRGTSSIQFMSAEVLCMSGFSK